ncbi:putative immunity protein [Streptomyces sp. NPDC059688]|uniref:putative immunity protein n=1 Tax=Streptomyces sp. NPDC059688 TaxID=3346906 RepID=UPI0036775B6E
MSAKPTEPDTIELTTEELQEITGFAAECARRVLPIFERSLPGDSRPRAAVEAAQAFADGGRRTQALRTCAWAAYKAAGEVTGEVTGEAADGVAGEVPGGAAAADAARAASHAAAAAYLHPKASAHQVKHILGAAAHAARAEELASGGGRDGTGQTLAWARHHAPPAVTAVLGRLPAAPPGGGRVGELVRDLDTALRA